MPPSPIWQQQNEGEEAGLTNSGFQEFVADVACGVGSDDDLEAMLAPFIPLIRKQENRLPV